MGLVETPNGVCEGLTALALMRQVKGGNNMFTMRDEPNADYSECEATTVFNKSIAPMLHALSLMLFGEHQAARETVSVYGPTNLGNAYRLAYEAYDLAHSAVMAAQAADRATGILALALEETGTLDGPSGDCVDCGRSGVADPEGNLCDECLVLADQYEGQ